MYQENILGIFKPKTFENVEPHDIFSVVKPQVPELDYDKNSFAEPIHHHDDPAYFSQDKEINDFLNSDEFKNFEATYKANCEAANQSGIPFKFAQALEALDWEEHFYHTTPLSLNKNGSTVFNTGSFTLQEKIPEIVPIIQPITQEPSDSLSSPLLDPNFVANFNFSSIDRNMDIGNLESLYEKQELYRNENPKINIQELVNLCYKHFPNGLPSLSKDTGSPNQQEQLSKKHQGNHVSDLINPVDITTFPGCMGLATGKHYITTSGSINLHEICKKYIICASCSSKTCLGCLISSPSYSFTLSDGNILSGADERFFEKNDKKIYKFKRNISKSDKELLIKLIKSITALIIPDRYFTCSFCRDGNNYYEFPAIKIAAMNAAVTSMLSERIIDKIPLNYNIKID